MKKEEFLTAKIKDYIKEREEYKLNAFDKKLVKNEKTTNGLAELEDSRAHIVASHVPEVWLTNAASRAGQISFVSHAPKYSHSDVKGAGINVFKQQQHSLDKEGFFSSRSLLSPKIDVVGNAAALDVASLLQLEHDGESLLDFLLRGDVSPLRPFVKTDEQLTLLKDGFERALQEKNSSTHSLSKQLYFPISEDEYHLLGPLYASSFAQSIYNRISDNRFTEHSKEARTAKRDGKYSDNHVISFPNLAIQYFGGTKPQNISKLNTLRHGKSYLLRSAPPSSWNSTMRPPLTNENVFNGAYSRLAWKTVKSLQNYLLSIKGKVSTKACRERRAEYIDDLMDILLHYAAKIQGMREQAGWSAKSKLPQPQRLWLDPYRQEDDFQQERSKNEWQEKIAKQFAQWVNSQLSVDSLKMGDVEFDEWSKQLSNRMSRLKEDMKVMAQ